MSRKPRWRPPARNAPIKVEIGEQTHYLSFFRREALCGAPLPASYSPWSPLINPKLASCPECIHDALRYPSTVRVGVYHPPRPVTS